MWTEVGWREELLLMKLNQEKKDEHHTGEKGTSGTPVKKV